MHLARADEPMMPSYAEAKQAMLALWDDELILHFDEEEALLLPILSPKLAARLRQEHADLRAEFSALAGATKANVVAAAANLRQHVRWEEDEMFPWLQDHLDEENLATLWVASQKFRAENGRPVQDAS